MGGRVEDFGQFREIPPVTAYVLKGRMIPDPSVAQGKPGLIFELAVAGFHDYHAVRVR